MDFLKDIKIVHLEAFKKSFKSFKSNWQIIPIGFLYSFLYSKALRIIGELFLLKGLRIIAGLLLAIVMVGLTSNYLFLLSNIIKYDNFTLENFKEGFKFYFRKVYSVFFVTWIARLIIGYMGNNVGPYSEAFYTVVSILIFIGLNPLPETIYQKYYSAYESIAYSFEFMKENWVNWLLPNIILGLILYKLSGVVLSNVITKSIEYNFFIFREGHFILNQIIISYMMLYRGHLFNTLSNSTRRKRLYMQKLND